MSKAKRKPKPSMPLWWWLDNDFCWQCKLKNHCNSCGILKKAVKEMPKLNRKKYMGR